jgi:PRC-barrel domain
MADPVSWLMIEKGWTVLASEGEQIGVIDEVVGDSGTDIFDGLTIKTGALSSPRYVPAEQVEAIVEGRVTLKLSPAEAEQLEEYEPPGAEEAILPESASALERLVGWLRGGRR